MQSVIEELENDNASLGQRIGEIIARNSFLEDAQEMADIQRERINIE